VGQDFPISVIYNIAEFGIDKGTTLEDSQGVARLIQDAGADAIHARLYGYGYYKGGKIENRVSNLPHIAQKRKGGCRKRVRKALGDERNLKWKNIISRRNKHKSQV